MSTARRTYPGIAVRLVKPLTAIAAALLVTGCVAHPSMPLPSNVAPFGRDVTLIYVPGIGGYRHHDRNWVEGLRAGGFSGKTETWDWTGQLAPIQALWAHARQRAEARRIAERVRGLRSESPSGPIVLVGHSAGAGLVVRALEDLPADLQVDNVVLLAPALSRTYDLTLALQHVRGRADVFCSDRDTLVLALGTFLFGTLDGVHGEAAGHGGFIEPRSDRSGAYAKLAVHNYSDDRSRFGDDGGHEGLLAPGVAAAVIAPMLPGHELRQDALAGLDACELP